MAPEEVVVGRVAVEVADTLTELVPGMVGVGAQGMAVVMVGMGTQAVGVGVGEEAAAEVVEGLHPGLGQALVQDMDRGPDTGQGMAGAVEGEEGAGVGEEAEALGVPAGVAPGTGQGAEAGTEAGAAVAKEEGEEEEEAAVVEEAAAAAELVPDRDPVTGADMDRDTAGEMSFSLEEDEEEMERMINEIVDDKVGDRVDE